MLYSNKLGRPPLCNIVKNRKAPPPYPVLRNIWTSPYRNGEASHITNYLTLTLLGSYFGACRINWRVFGNWRWRPPFSSCQHQLPPISSPFNWVWRRGLGTGLEGACHSTRKFANYRSSTSTFPIRPVCVNLRPTEYRAWEQFRRT